MTVAHEQRIALVALIGGAPAVIAAHWWVWSGDAESKLQWTVALVVTVVWLVGAAMVRERVATPIRLIGNMLSALRQGDVTIRVRKTGSDDLGATFSELNTLADLVREKQLGALEAVNLLQRVMEKIEVAVFAIDADGTLQLVNATGAELLASTPERLIGSDASELGLTRFLELDSPIVDARLPAGPGRFEVRKNQFRQRGVHHELLVLSDVSRALRQEEREAWRRLIRVFGHEINNSLTPIQSMAESLRKRTRRADIEPALAAELEEAFDVIEARARSLSRFMHDYARLAKLPPPHLDAVEVPKFVAQVVALESRLPVAIDAGPPVSIRADRAQIEQALINLVKNAVEASQQARAEGAEVRVSWRCPQDDQLEIVVADNGDGVSSDDNLFVPFFTTKKDGSGIGLVLSQHIAEAHGGSVALETHEGGCRAVLRLPTHV